MINSTSLRTKQRVLHALRSAGLLGPIESTRQALTIANDDPDNDRFCREHPDFVPPPKAAMYDAYGTISFQAYWQVGQYFARVIVDLALPHCPKPRRVLEWGCGPARIIQHLPSLLSTETLLFGTDYNPQSIAWCAATFPQIKFTRNELSPPLLYAFKYFDVIYAVSVFTHLSVDQQKAWATELRRLLADDGVLIFTANGERCAHLLLPAERARFENDGVVVRDQVKEGTRCFLSYNSPEYVRAELFPDLKVHRHIAGYAGAPATEQDIWVLGR